MAVSTLRTTYAVCRCRALSYQKRLLSSTITSFQRIASHDPLKPTILISNLGLPLSPQSTPPTSTPAQPLSSSDMERLHRLSALNPPLPGSAEEKELLEGLNELVGLMEAVKAVELPEGKDAVQKLLNRGVGEVVIGQDTGGEGEKEKVEGRELLKWATRRKGDYYHSKAGKRADEE